MFVNEDRIMKLPYMFGLLVDPCYYTFWPKDTLWFCSPNLVILIRNWCCYALFISFYGANCILYFFDLLYFQILVIKLLKCQK